VSEHVVFGENLEAYAHPELGGQKDGRQPTGSDGHWLDPLVVLSMIAATTTHVRLATNVLQAALRRPVVLAKELATLDVLSGGRVDLGVGVGWQKEEYDAAGLDFHRRGHLLDHTLDVVTTLWREPRAGFSDDELTFEAIHMMPKPVQSAGIPIWVSGTYNDAVVRRIARFGSGWILWGPAAEDPAGSIAQMRAALGQRGADASTLRVAGLLTVVRRDDGWMDIRATMAEVPRLVEAGVTDFRGGYRLPGPEEEVRQYLCDVVGEFRAATE
jgi:probable F420-dependent oxidoreductase